MIWEYFKYFEFGYCKFGNAIFYDTFDLICDDQIKQKILCQCGQLLLCVLLLLQVRHRLAHRSTGFRVYIRQCDDFQIQSNSNILMYMFEAYELTNV